MFNAKMQVWQNSLINHMKKKRLFLNYYIDEITKRSALCKGNEIFIGTYKFYLLIFHIHHWLKWVVIFLVTPLRIGLRKGSLSTFTLKKKHDTRAGVAEIVLGDFCVRREVDFLLVPYFILLYCYCYCYC